MTVEQKHVECTFSVSQTAINWGNFDNKVKKKTLDNIGPLGRHVKLRLTLFDPNSSSSTCRVYIVINSESLCAACHKVQAPDNHLELPGLSTVTIPPTLPHVNAYIEREMFRASRYAIERKFIIYWSKRSR